MHIFGTLFLLLGNMLKADYDTTDNNRALALVDVANKPSVPVSVPVSVSSKASEFTCFKFSPQLLQWVN
jgi:hypothetical protein